jgi:hypothetical protein
MYAVSGLSSVREQSADGVQSACVSAGQFVYCPQTASIMLAMVVGRATSQNVRHTVTPLHTRPGDRLLYFAHRSSMGSAIRAHCALEHERRLLQPVADFSGQMRGNRHGAARGQRRGTWARTVYAL